MQSNTSRTGQVLLISSSEIGQRVAQHRNVIDAAKRAGVKLLVYTSVLRADITPLHLADEHLTPVQVPRDSGRELLWGNRALNVEIESFFESHRNLRTFRVQFPDGLFGQTEDSGARAWTLTVTLRAHPAEARDEIIVQLQQAVEQDF